MSQDQKEKELLAGSLSPTTELGPVNQLMELLKNLDTTSDEAKLNETTISDGEGGRIYL